MKFTAATVAAVCCVAVATLSDGVSAFAGVSKESLAFVPSSSSSSSSRATPRCTSVAGPAAACRAHLNVACSCLACRGTSTAFSRNNPYGGGGGPLFAFRYIGGGCDCDYCTNRPITSAIHPTECPCSSCTAVTRSKYGVGCSCSSCATSISTRPGGRLRSTKLYATADDESSPEEVEASSEATTQDNEVPEEVMAMDGIESPEEAHNVERPARKYISKKTVKGEALGELKIGSTVKGTVKSITSYGAFVDFGSSTDGLLHISQMSTEYVSDVSALLTQGQEVDVRIIRIDEAAGKINLSLLSEEEEEEAALAAMNASSGRDNNQNRRDSDGSRDNEVAEELVSRGWDINQFVEGTVVTVVDFGCFVKFDVSQFYEDLAGEMMDGLVHISALSTKRVDVVSNVVNVNDKVKVRVKNINGRKVSLTMISAEDERAKTGIGSSGGQSEEENLDWKTDLESFISELEPMQNKPLVSDLRK